ncbi:MAG: hypothetical protein WCP58_10645, partial [bacterium]
IKRTMLGIITCLMMFSFLGSVGSDFKFHCGSNPSLSPWVKSYNRKLAFTKTKTLMNGDEFCHNTYYVET